MRWSHAAFMLAGSLLYASGSACAMNMSSAKLASCRVFGAEKLPASSGGADALCAAIERAGGQDFSVQVQVLSLSSLKAVVTMADGRILPEQRFDVSDRELTKSSFERFAQNLVAESADTSPR